jgi:succinate dehydrogenase/fumarate reductase flavoprotein subunit
MEYVQVHPTGLVNLKDPNSKTKWLAAEAMRGCGAIILDGEGNRFVDELGRRDYVSGEMAKGKGPFRLILNGDAFREIEWHCKHYVGRNLMKKVSSGKDLAAEIGCSVDHLSETFRKYRDCAKKGTD